MQRDGLVHSKDSVVAVRPPGADFQPQIDLGKSANANGGRQDECEGNPGLSEVSSQ